MEQSLTLRQLKIVEVRCPIISDSVHNVLKVLRSIVQHMPRSSYCPGDLKCKFKFANMLLFFSLCFCTKTSQGN